MTYLNLTNPEELEEGIRGLQLVEPALEYTDGLWTLEDVKDALLEGRMQMWILNRSVLVTQLEVYPTKLITHVFLGAGELDDCHELLSHVEEWASNVGAEKVLISGRKGWVRDLNPFGYRHTSITVAKDL
jgi:hypothetical protein